MKKNSTGMLNAFMHLMDWAAVASTAFICHRLYLGYWETPSSYNIAIMFGMVLTVWFFSIFGLYNTSRGRSILDEFRDIFLAWSTVFLVLAIIEFFTKTGLKYSRVWGLLWYATGLITIVSCRVSLRLLLQWLRKYGHNRRKLVIIGNSRTVERLVISIRNTPGAGFDLAGLFLDEEVNDDKFIAPKLGDIAQAGAYCESNSVDHILIALPLKLENRVHEILYELRNTTANISYVPDLFGIRLINQSAYTFAGVPVINLSSSPMVGANRIIKALEDRLIAISILILCSPLLLIIALGVKLSSPGAILYKQERVGWNNRTFMILKFRSMRTNAEDAGVQWGNSGKKEVTRFGSFLRKTSLDELPQFFNVIKGDMSIVGPRPERLVFVNELKNKIPGYMKKHMVKAGITGLAQINGFRGDTDLGKRIEYDLTYIETWSLWLDIKIIIQTVFKGFINRETG